MKPFICALFNLVLLAACKPVATGPVETLPVPGQTPSPSRLAYTDASLSLEVRLEDILDRMTLDEKIAQMVQPIQNATSPGDVEAFSCGSIL